MAGYPPAQAFTRRATTGVGGFALLNGTGTILTWTAPDDGQLHSVLLMARLVVSQNETGGAIQATYPTAGTIFAAGLAVGTYMPGSVTPNHVAVAPATTIALLQNTALTAGAAILYAEFWAT